MRERRGEGENAASATAPRPPICAFGVSVSEERAVWRDAGPPLPAVTVTAEPNGRCSPTLLSDHNLPHIIPRAAPRSTPRMNATLADISSTPLHARERHQRNLNRAVEAHCKPTIPLCGDTPKLRNTATPKHRNTETPKHRNTETLARSARCRYLRLFPLSCARTCERGRSIRSSDNHHHNDNKLS